MEKYAGARSVRSTANFTSSPTPPAKKGRKKSTVSSQRATPRLVTVRLSKKLPKLTADQKRQLEYTRNLPDDQIDTSDIPELTEEQLRNRTVYINLVPVPGTGKTSVTIRLDKDMVAWFKRQGKGWQTKMNWVLRLYFASHRKTGVKVGRP
jgi:uncharacterized protein (DUF4415 family)